MLIECKNCGAPLDVTGRESFVKCRYCDHSSKVASLRTVAQATPEGWRAPSEWRPPEHVPARSDMVLKYHEHARRLVGWIMTSVFLVVGLGVATSFLATQSVSGAIEGLTKDPAAQQKVQESTRAALSQAAQALEKAGLSARGALDSVSVQKVNYFAEGGPLQAAASFKQALGSENLAVKQLVLYPEYAFMEARNPKKPKHFDRYPLRNGVVDEPSPITTSSLGQDIEKKVFDLNAVALAKIPQLIQDTVKKLGYEDGQASHVIIQSNLPFSKDVVIRVYVRSERDSGRIDYRANGSELRVFR